MLHDLTVAQVASILENEVIPEHILEILTKDSRKSVMALLERWRRRQNKVKQEYNRLQALYMYEKQMEEHGYNLIAGVDEAGRGPIAGPLVVGSVILPHKCIIKNLNDSKKLSARQRENLYGQIVEKAVAFTYKVVELGVIEKLNIYQATVWGMTKCLEQLNPSPDAILVDAVPLDGMGVPVRSIINGDAVSASIAAASIIAKVERDKIMDYYDDIYPQYGFRQHKGYCTSQHIQAIKKYGPCPIHRMTFEPLRSLGVADDDKDK